MKRAILTFIAVWTAGYVFALDVPYRDRPGTGGLPGDWLSSFSASAREAGLANASTALNGPSVAYSNPAGILDDNMGEMEFLMAPLASAGRYQSISVSYPMSERDRAGLSFLYLTSGDAEKTNSFGESQGSFSEEDLAFLSTYGRRFFSNRLMLGLNAKVVRQSMDGYSTTGLGSDFGVQYHPSSDWLTLGLSFQNILPPTLKLKSETDSYPLIIKSGAAFHAKYFDRSFLLSTEATQTKSGGSGNLHYGVGLEMQPLKASTIPLFLRFGWNQKEITMGFGFRNNTFNFDYAASVNELEMLHRFGMGFRFGDQSKSDDESLQRKMERLREKEADLRQREFNLTNTSKRTGQNQTNPPLSGSVADQTGEQSGKDRVVSANYLEQAKTYYNAKQYQNCLEILKLVNPKMVDETVYSTLGTMSRAQILIEQEDYKSALPLLVKAMELDPGNDEVKRLYERIKDIREAQGHE